MFEVIDTRNIKLTIFQKLFLFVLLVIVMFCGVSVYFNYLSEQRTRNEVIRSSLSKAELFLSSFTNDIERIINVQNQFVNDSNLMMLSSDADSMSVYDRQKSIKDLHSLLYFLMSASKYIDDVSIQIPGINRIISTTSSIDILDDQDFDSIRSFKSTHGNFFIPIDNKLYINMPYPTASRKDKEPLFNLRVSISKKEIRNTLLQFFEENGGGCIIAGNNNWVIATDDAIASGILTQLKNEGVDIFSTGQWLSILRVNGRSFWVMGYYSADLGAGIVEYIPEDIILGHLIMYRYWYLCLACFSILILAAYAYWANKRFGSPMKRLVYAFKRVEMGEFAYTISHKSKDEFAYLYSQFNSMMQKIEQLIHQVYEQRIMMQQAEMQQLQYQINPHFLYNSIYLIYCMAVVQDHESIKRLSKHLGGYYKYITRRASDTVPLYEEVAHMMNYLEVQKIRFYDRIQVETGDIPDGCGNTLVPSLILQPIIENAYGHGLEEKNSGGLIVVSYQTHGRHLLIHIDDNGKGIDNEKLMEFQQKSTNEKAVHGATGLLNVHRRLAILYGDECGIGLSRSELGGLRVSVRILIERGEANV